MKLYLYKIAASATRLVKKLQLSFENHLDDFDMCRADVHNLIVYIF